MASNCLKLIGCWLLLLTSVTGVSAASWIDLVTLPDKQRYQIAPASLATNKISGELYLFIDGRSLSVNGATKQETVAFRESDCKRTSGYILVQREDGVESQIPFSESIDNLPYKLLRVVCGTYTSVKKLLDK